MKKFTLSIVFSVVLLFVSLTWAKNNSFGIVGDMGVWNYNSQAIRDSMLRKQVKQLIMAGDNLYDLFSSYPSTWKPWIDKGFLFSIVAIGNHNMSYQLETRFFKIPGEYYSQVREDLGIKFIVLNSDNIFTVDQQLAFLVRELNTNRQKYQFVIYHHPSFSVTVKHPWTEKENFQTKIRKVILEQKDKISLLIWGHDHIMATYDFNGIPVLLSGSSQDPRDGGNYNIPRIQGFEFQRKWLASSVEPYWVSMDSDYSPDGFQFQVVRAQNDQVVCSMFLDQNRNMIYGADCAH